MVTHDQPHPTLDVAEMRLPRMIAAPLPHEGIARALRASFGEPPPLSEDLARLLARMR